MKIHNNQKPLFTQTKLLVEREIISIKRVGHGVFVSSSKQAFMPEGEAVHDKARDTYVAHVSLEEFFDWLCALARKKRNQAMTIEQVESLPDAAFQENGDIDDFLMVGA